MAKVAFIGLGNMGGGIAANLAKAGHEVVAFDLADAALERAKANGCTIATSAEAAVEGVDAVVTMLPAGKHVAGGLAVQPFRHLVEKPEGLVGEQEAGQRKPARLAAGKPLSRFAKPRLQSTRHGLDVFGKARRREDLPQLALGRGRICQP